MDVQEFSSDAPVASIASALRGDGAAVVHNLAPAETADAVADDLRAYFDAEGTYAQCDFNGYKTLRLSAILARSRASANLIGHERVLGVLDEILLAHCINYRIGSTTAVEILPGEGDQTLHRDDSIYPARMPGMEWQVSVMWALTDFTEENGATRVVPGSHREWMQEGGPPTGEIQKAMRRGSALIYLGSTLHGGGANRSNVSRIGLVNVYSLGWLRQEVNQYLTIPQEIAGSYPEKIQRLLGYQSHGPLLGKYPDAPDGGWFLKDELDKS
jgi:ectoine hydroxylase-related dioxygenase (phytanoyl-CoA dioxygenase family)